MSKYLRDPVIWLLCFVALVGVWTPVNFLGELHMPFGGFISVMQLQYKNWGLDSATPPWWSGMDDNGLKKQDILLSINNQVYSGITARRVFQEAFENGDQTVTLNILRNSSTLSIKVPVKTLQFDDFLDIAVPNFINSFCYWLVSLGVYSLRPRDRMNRIFAITCCCVAASQSLLHSSVFPISSFYTWTTNFLWALISPFVGITILHFSTIFPLERSHPFIKIFIKAAYIIAALIGVTFAFTRILFVLQGFSDFAALLDRWCFRLVMGCLFLGWAIFLVNGILSYVIVYLKTHKPQPQTTVALLSVLISALHVVPNSLIAFDFDLPIFLANLDVRYFLVSVPIGFAVISLRYKSFRSSQPPLWLLLPLIISASASISSFSAWLWWILSFPNMPRPPFGQVLIICLFVIVLWNFLSSIRGFLARILNWEAVSYALVQEFNHNLVGNTNLASLPHVMAQFLMDGLKLDQTAIWLWSEETKQFEPAAISPSNLSIDRNLKLLNHLALVYNQPVRLGNEKNSISAWLNNFIDTQSWEIALPLGTDRPIGLILFGQRMDDEIFDERDLNILALIAQQATLFLFSAQVTYWLDKAQEDERFRIAQDLHDTTQQSLNAVSIHLHMIKKLVYYDIKQAELYAIECQEDIKEAIQNLYEIRRSLDPSELVQGLIVPLQLLIERTRRIRGLNTSFVSAPHIDDNLSPLTRRAIYRMIKQALDNTLAHADANKFNVRLETDNKKLLFYIEDDGKGSSLEQRNLAVANGHIGLKTMRTRIESLGGELIYQSEQGYGTQITGWIPIS